MDHATPFAYTRPTPEPQAPATPRPTRHAGADGFEVSAHIECHDCPAGECAGYCLTTVGRLRGSLFPDGGLSHGSR